MRKRREEHKKLTYLEKNLMKTHNRWPTTVGRVKIVKVNGVYHYRFKLHKGWFAQKDYIRVIIKNEP